MEEIMFRLSNQLETLQIQASVSAQQGQQILGSWISQGQQTFKDLSDDLYGQEIKQFIQQIITLFQAELRKINYQLSTINLNPKYIYYRVLNFYSAKVSKREFIYFFTGMLIGGVIGHYWVLNRFSPKHLHHMKAIVCNHYIGVEGVSLIEDAEMPTIQKPNEILIQVKAASINEIDVQICSGYSRAYRKLLNSGRCKDLPVILGRDCAGVVVDIGHNVINFDVGDNVFVAVPSWSTGTMAEYIAVPENRVSKMPKILPYEAAASLPYSGCIAWHTIVNCSTIEIGNAHGKRVLVYGGSTPVGCILIQLVKVWGGYVVTICKPQAASVIKALGADEIILFNDTDIFKQLETRDKFDAIFNTGRQTVDDKILRKHLVPNGSYISTAPEYLISDSLGYITGSLFSGCIRIKLLLQYVFGATNCHWKEGSKLNSDFLQSLQVLADSKKLQPILDRIYTLNSVDQALSHILDSNAIGSTVIKFSQ
ncbi:reticulon-4-interacting protein 1 homolog, mitochondrial-like [Trichogramma pretiosum]|uniref:reticulon-4-interacting protein 1 homolog, mitochondrial-like n=1 Tax=Trichogramma pretiosum TaxID=7493 RepID=UPI0006C9ABE0|nr:reticulon-4-interacting protein 1 homolog, mitochondrial-like [Trichogramma pretiosum]XP_014234290.1 reticulon-4-interacting protein 1 homolog, mitochondrial-like [Trichogramma pretiosum]XP_014234291.1 reticulon-4-interacting protein 1 homolog, mitochondrial-like [Trichogramma pretiosum]XP_023317001.1 reticulon-4-interacting protein 1 homolog, mitochondrial-like [Trichogramma pretiosum]XP_023317002.1 reticulon-4-interacting protein 1 homolog, mitochondrial-like [Trichogramma pretiosum]